MRTLNRIVFTLTLVLSYSLTNCQSQNSLSSDYLKQAIRGHNYAEEDFADFIITSDHVSRTSGTHHVYFVQRYQGVEINNATASVHVLPDGQLLHANYQFVRSLAQKIDGPVVPTISAKEAIEQVVQIMGYQILEPIELLEENSDTDNRQLFSNGGFSLENIPVRLKYQIVDENKIRLAWDLSVDELDGNNWWSIRIDATTGELLHKNSWTVSCNFEHDHSSVDYTSNDDCMDIISEPSNTSPAGEMMVGSYNVYPIPVESPNFGGRSMVSDPENATASPYGWHDTNGSPGAEHTITKGNNVDAYEDGDNSGYSPDGGPGLVFDFPINTTYSTANQSEDAAITNLFYWGNVCHDLWYMYGFDEASGNFQDNNYGNGGAGNDWCRCEAQDGSGTCNANMSTPTDGNLPRMQMYVCDDRDGDIDNGVIVHEYGHGISIRLTGGANNSNCLNNNEQMGEGWSDWFGMVMTIEPSDMGSNSRGMGTWLFGQGPNGPGIRPHPYSTDMGINPHTYNNIDGVSIPHGVGSVWCVMLWEMTWGLIDEYGFDSDVYTGTGGNNIAMALVTEALKIQPCSPGFVDGRDAILSADLALYGGANECIIWDAFAKRGLGLSASQGSTGSVTDGTEAFDKPAACSFPALAFTIGGLSTAEGASPENPPLGGDCRPYTDYNIEVELSSDPSSPAIAEIIVSSGTADFNDYELLNTTMFFPIAGIEFATLRIFNDATIELTENLNLELLLNNGGSTDAQLGDITEMNISIVSNEIEPVPPSPITLDDADFENDADDYTSTNPNGGGKFLRGTESDASSTYWTVPPALDGSAYMFYANDDFCDCDMLDVFLETPLFDFTYLTAAELRYDVFFEERTYQSITESADVMISTDGGANYTVLQNIAGVNDSWREEVIDLSAYDGMNNIKIAFNYSDGSGWLYGIAIDNVRVSGTLAFEPNISTTLDFNDEQDVPANAVVYFYHADGTLLASIQNGATDLGCVQVTIDREGTGATPFWDNFPEHYLADKTYLITPEFNGPNLDYTVTLYYTQAEVAGWESITGKLWEAQAKIIKHPTTIADVTPANPEPNGPGTIEQAIDFAANTDFNPTNYFITASFNTGFSGMGVGDPETTPLPVELISFEGYHETGLGNRLLWSTASETDNDYFVLERSFNGSDFEPIGQISGMGTTSEINTYDYLDRDLKTGNHYYRLKQVDLDGKFELSQVVIIKVIADHDITVFPNPARDFITISFASALSNEVAIKLFDSNGKEALTTIFQLNQESQVDLNIQNIPKGVYIGEVVNTITQENYHFRFVKK